MTATDARPDDGEAAREQELARQLATLALSCVQPSGPIEAIAAASWWNMLARLGIQLPLVVVHDFGLLLTRGRERRGRQVVRREGPSAAAVLARYHQLLSEVAAAEIIEDLGAAPLPDDAVAVILARVMGDVYLRWPGRPRQGAAVAGVGAAVDTLPASSPLYERPRPSTAAGERDGGWALPFLHRLCELDRAVLARLDQIDAGSLRLLGLFSVDAGFGDLADLYQLVTTPGTSDVVDFSLQLLPSLLETKRRPAAQRFSINGYASVERRGSLDALLPGELAHDDDAFALKALSDDLLFYGHERPQDSGRKLHYVLVDASASMRGTRQVFARGLALALAKKFSLMGGEVWVRFFDSRLYDRLDVGGAGRRDLPRLLCFRSERGRNYARVFGDLAVEVTRLRREQGRDVAVTFITHAECHIPLPTVEALAREAYLYGIFVQPSKPLDVEYLSRLHRHQVVTADTLSRAADKRRRALDIVEDAASG
ncbi:MAG TPA: hypothetical protein VMU50_08885 [Polyangia bacterium]|nr:hypothetical protein [Polyangia bacterium]